jgi:hypothetical protein
LLRRFGSEATAGKNICGNAPSSREISSLPQSHRIQYHPHRAAVTTPGSAGGASRITQLGSS